MAWLTSVAFAGGLEATWAPNPPDQGVLTHHLRFGADVDVSGDTAVVGAPRNNGDDGHVYVYSRDDLGRWSLRATLAAPDPQPRESFGSQVAIDHGVLAVSSVMRDVGHEDVGLVNLYRVDPGGTWRHEATLTGPAVAGARFGQGLTLWDDGRALAVGSAGERTGGVSVYRWSDEWSLEVHLVHPRSVPDTFFGQVLAGDGDRLAVGSSWEDVVTTATAEASGAVWLFRKVGGIWQLETSLHHPNPGYRQGFGSAIALDGDLLVIGAYYETTVDGCHAGTVHLFRQDSGWRHEASLRPPVPGLESYFGLGVAVDGERVLIGSAQARPNGIDSGAAWLFERTSGRWLPTVTLTPPSPRTQDWFGKAVAMDGDRVVVGSDVRLGEATVRSGSAFVFGVEAR